MNSFVPTAALTRDRYDAGQPRRRSPVLRVALLSAAVLVLPACAPLRTHTPPRIKPPVAVATAPEPAPAFAVLDPGSYQLGKDRIKQVLARDDEGALAAADVGYYMDVLVGRLRQVAGQSIGISRQGNRIALDLSRRVGFEPTGPQLGPGVGDSLAPISKVLVEYRKVLVAVRVSPIDAASASNPRLAEQRALAVAHQLADAGVGGKRIVIAGVGAKTAANTRIRVELQLEPIVRSAGGP